MKDIFLPVYLVLDIFCSILFTLYTKIILKQIKIINQKKQCCDKFKRILFRFDNYTRIEFINSIFYFMYIYYFRHVTQYTMRTHSCGTGRLLNSFATFCQCSSFTTFRSVPLWPGAWKNNSDSIERWNYCFCWCYSLIFLLFSFFYVPMF